MTHALQAYLGRVPATIPDRNTDEARNWSVGTYVRPGHIPWLDAALEVRGITEAQAPRALEAVRAILTQNNSDVDTVRCGSGPIRGRIYVRWTPRREDNAVNYANQISRAFLAAAQREFSPSSAFIMRRFHVIRLLNWPDVYVYPETDFSTVTRETLPSEVVDARGRTVPVEEVGRDQSGSLSPVAQTALIVGGAAAGVLAIGGLGFYLVGRRSGVKSNKSNKRKRSSR